MGGAHVKILAGHLREQIADVLDNAVQPGHHVRRGPGQLRRLILAADLGDRGLEIALHQLLHPLAAGPHGIADMAGQLQSHHNGGQTGGHHHQHIHQHSGVCILEIVLLHGHHGNAPAVGAAHRGVGRVIGALAALEAAEAVLPLAHLLVNGGQLLQGGVALGLPLNVLGGDGVQRVVGNGVAGLVNHIGPAVLADLDGGDNIVQEGLRRHEIDHAHNGVPPAAAGVDGRGHDDGQLPCDLADQGLGHIHSAAHGLLHILPVRVVVSVKNAPAVEANDIAPLEAVHGHPLVNDAPLDLHRHHAVGQLGDAARIHGHILVRGQLLLHPLRRQHRGLAHHLVHRGDSAPVVESDAGCSHQEQRDHNGCHQAYRDFLADTCHLCAPHNTYSVCFVSSPIPFCII